MIVKVKEKEDVVDIVELWVENTFRGTTLKGRTFKNGTTGMPWHLITFTNSGKVELHKNIGVEFPFKKDGSGSLILVKEG